MCVLRRKIYIRSSSIRCCLLLGLFPTDHGRPGRHRLGKSPQAAGFEKPTNRHPCASASVPCAEPANWRIHRHVTTGQLAPVNGRASTGRSHPLPFRARRPVQGRARSVRVQSPGRPRPAPTRPSPPPPPTGHLARPRLPRRPPLGASGRTPSLHSQGVRCSRGGCLGPAPASRHRRAAAGPLL